MVSKNTVLTEKQIQDIGERFEDEMEELYYREPVTKEEIRVFSDELLKKL